VEGRGRQSGTRVPHRDDYAIGLNLPGADQQISRPRFDTVHRLDRVDDQVEDHLLQLDPIAVDERQALGEVHLHRGAGPYRFAAGELNHLADRLVYGHPVLPWGRLFDELTDSANDVAGAIPSWTM